MNRSRKIARRISRWGRSLRHPTFLPVLVFLARTARTPPAPGSRRPDLAPDVAGGDRSRLPTSFFQTWKSKTDIPDSYRYWRASLLEQNPDFDLVLFDDDDNANFAKSHFPHLMDIYEAMPREIFRADLIRPMYLFVSGGFYVDMDSECLRPVKEQCLTHADVVLGTMGRDDSFEHSIPNAIMASRPRQAFWLLYIAVICERFRRMSAAGELQQAEPEDVTGPIALKEAVDCYVGSTQSQVTDRIAWILDELDPSLRHDISFGPLQLLPPDVWYALDWTNPMHRKLRDRIQRRRSPLSPHDARQIFPHATLITYWTHSW